MISWLTGSKYAAAAQEIASLIARDIPPGIDLSRLDLSASRVTTILQRSYSRAEAFEKSAGMNWIRRAQFANFFKWRLTEMGYPSNFIDVATEGLIYALSGSESSKARPPRAGKD